ncbi:hypothetical protein [Achromobacter insolitus]|uniref:hypothetical protein n=1 Tax=Achromobacter insolitus TaxID=217204 RepID=UPI001EEE627C|nr:hypothetical protein [Achromobacter insolitus]
MGTNDFEVKCTRCRKVQLHSDLIERPRRRRSTAELPMSDLVCPRCGCKSYYEMTPQVAWCWASGLIEIGSLADLPADSVDGGGAIAIAWGPKYALRGFIEVVARHGYSGGLLVPGVPEATDQRSKGDALGKWLDWCSGHRSAGRDGISFASMAKSAA